MEDRLSRVEKKIDSLQEAIISLARVEERLVTVFNRQSSIESKVTHIEDKVDTDRDHHASYPIDGQAPFLPIRLFPLFYLVLIRDRFESDHGYYQGNERESQ